MARINRGRIEALEPHEVFVFGSNLAGRHGLGAAKLAKERYGARYGVGQGLTGQSYALPTKDGSLRVLPLEAIGEQMQRLGETATAHPDRVFYLTRVGQGLAGYDDGQIRPLIEQAGLPANVKPYWEWESSGGGVGGGEEGHPLRLIVAGGRDFEDYGRLSAALQEALGDHPLDQLEVVSGAARGADRLGEQWAKEHGVALRQFPADWNTHGKRAGYLRNEQMAQYADAVLVMPGGRGTDHMADYARRRGLTVHDYRQRVPGEVAAAVSMPFEIVASRGPGASFDVLGMRERGQTMATVSAPFEPGWLGNPFVAVDAGGRLSREEATAAFGELVREKAQDAAWRDAFLSLRGKRIGYYKPEESAIHLHELQRWIAEQDGDPAVAGVAGVPAGPRRVQLELALDGGGSPPPPPPPRVTVVAESPEPGPGPGPAPAEEPPLPPREVVENPERKAGDLLPWLLAAGAGGLLGLGAGVYSQREDEAEGQWR